MVDVLIHNLAKRAGSVVWRPRRASLSEVQHLSWIASHPKNLCFNRAKEHQTSLAAGSAVHPAKQARYVSRVEYEPDAENFQEKESGSLGAKVMDCT
jgi:hypothetical protein